MTAETVSAVLVRGGEIEGEALDLLAAGGRITAVGADLRPDQRHEVVDAAGGAVLPGLHDHHVHLFAMAAAHGSVDLSAGDLGVLRRAAAEVAPGGWVRATGYHERGGALLDREGLDALVGAVPARVQHATGALWILSSAAVAEVGPLPAEVGRSGQLYGDDAALAARWPAPELDLEGVARRLLARGVTAVTDATPVTSPDGLEALAALPLRVAVTGHPALGEVPDGLGRGPAKVVVGDHDLPGVDELAGLVALAHDAGRPVAVHCVTADALALLLAAWGEVGSWPADRVEHGAVIPAAAIGELAARGVTVVTQPGFVVDRGERYLDHVDPTDRPDLWRCASLRAGGVRVAAGSDAPFGPADPWVAIAAAVDRRTAGGRELGAEEGLTPDEALDLYLGSLDDPGGPPRRVALGAPADLCVLDRPLAEALARPAEVDVAATVAGGRVVG